jgi:carbohydrate kinase (thermoresistant glucokinase family)
VTRAADAGGGTPPDLPSVVVVMGVSGSGKTTISALLAGQLHWEFADADDFHPPANIEKMHKGIPLTDEDRWPWLRAIADWIDAKRQAGGYGVVACSALKRRYRDVLIGGNRPDVRLVYLKGSEALIGTRLTARQGHFMPTSLLKSQFEALEEPGPDERPIVVAVDDRPNTVVEEIAAALKAAGQQTAPRAGA